MSNGRKLVGYGECKCILTQYRDGTCDPIFEDVAQAPVSVMSADECAQDVYKHGQSIGLFDIPKETANAICAGITAITGARVDWHYIAGRVHMKALYAAPVALAAAAPKALPDEPLWDHKGNVRHDAVDRLGERQRAAWKMVRVNAAEFDELMDALQRAEDKGYLPDAMQAEWSAFQFYDASRDVSATAPQASALSKDAIREVFMAHGFTVKEGQTDLKQYVYDAAYALLARATALQATVNGAAPVAWRAPNLSGSGETWAYRDADDRFEDMSGNLVGEALYLQAGATLTKEQIERIAHECETECHAVPGVTMYMCAEMAVEATLEALSAHPTEQHKSTTAPEPGEIIEQTSYKRGFDEGREVGWKEQRMSDAARPEPGTTEYGSWINSAAKEASQRYREHSDRFKWLCAFEHALDAARKAEIDCAQEPPESQAEK